MRVVKRALVLTTLVLFSCTTFNRTTQMASDVVGVSDDAATGVDIETVQVLLHTMLSGLRDLLLLRRQFWISLVGTIEALALTQDAINYGIQTTVQRLCRMPGPEDITEEGAIFEEDQGELGDHAVLRVTGFLWESELPVEVTMDVGPEDATIDMRGGGWLLCGLSQGDIDVDGEPIYLGDPDQLESEMTVRAWPDGVIEENTLPTAVEVRYQARVDHEIIVSILRAETVTLWLEEIPIELFPEDSEALQQMLTWITGDTGDLDQERLEESADVPEVGAEDLIIDGAE